jgi:hypothetical protein
MTYQIENQIQAAQTHALNVYRDLLSNIEYDLDSLGSAVRWLGSPEEACKIELENLMIRIRSGREPQAWVSHETADTAATLERLQIEIANLTDRMRREEGLNS